MMKDEFVHLQIYKIWGEQIKNISCWFVSSRYHGHVLKMVAGIFNEVCLENLTQKMMPDTQFGQHWTPGQLAKGNTIKRIINKDLVVQEGVWKLIWSSVQLDT